MPSFFIGLLFAVAALFMFSTNILLIKAASDRVNLNLGFLISVAVNLVFCTLLFGIQLTIRDEGVHWNWHAALIFALAGVFSTYLGRWFFFEAIVRFGSAKASIFQVSSPVFAGLIAWLFLGESLPGVALVGISLTIFGLLTVAYVPGTFAHFPSTKPDSLLSGSRATTLWSSFVKRSSLILGLASSVAYAISTVLRGSGIREWNEPVLGALLGAATGLMLLAVTSSETRDIGANIRAADRRGMFFYGISGILTISAQICSIWSLRYIHISYSNLITLCTPLLVIPGSYFLFKNHERIALRTWLGGLLAITGIAVLILLR